MNFFLFSKLITNKLFVCGCFKVISSNGFINIKCHHDDQTFRNKSYAAVHLLLENEHQILPLSDFMNMFADKYNEASSERLIKAMKHAIEV